MSKNWSDIILKNTLHPKTVDEAVELLISILEDRHKMLLSILKDVKKRKLFIQSFNQSTILKIADRIFGIRVKSVQTYKQAKQIHSFDFDEIIRDAKGFQELFSGINLDSDLKLQYTSRV